MEKKKKLLPKINPKKFDPKKYIITDPKLDDKTMAESKNRSVVMTFGRFSPPTVGHEKLVNKIKSIASSNSADPIIFASHTYDKKKNPLTYDQKINFLQLAFGPVVKKTAARTIIEVAKELSDKYEKMIVVVGSDRVSEFQTLLDKYNGKEFNFKDIEVVSAGERDPDSDDVSGMSASKLRSLAVAGDFEAFKNGLPSKLKAHAKEVYETVLKGMKLMEDFEDETLDEKVNPLNYAQRLKRSMVMKRYHGKIEAARKRAQNRRASPEKIKDRARKKALSLLRARLSKTRAYGDMSSAEKLDLDKRLSRIPQDVINRIAVKQIPILRKAEAERIASLHAPKNESVDDQFEMFLENFIEEFNEINDVIGLEETRQKRFHKLFKKSGTVNHDKRFKFYRQKKSMFESIEDLEFEIQDLIESVETFVEEKDDPCWKGYTQFGMKKKGNKEVPNCIPVKEEKQASNEIKKGDWVIVSKKEHAQVSQYGGTKFTYNKNKLPASSEKMYVDKITKTKDGRKAHLKYKPDSMRGYAIMLDQLPDFMDVKTINEGQAMDMARASIAREKKADAEKHKNTMDNARKVDAKRRSLRTESSETIKKIIDREKKHKEIAKALKDFSAIAKNTDADDHMYHAAKIVKSHDMAMSAGDLVKLYNKIRNSKNYEKSYAVFDAWESVDKNNPRNREDGTDSLVKIFKKDTPGESVDDKFETFLEGKARGFEGQMVNVPNVPVRMANGKLKSFPAGKSSSSDGGDGE